MYNNILLISLNSQSFNCNTEIIKLLLDQSDVLFLQETLLTDVNCDLLHTLTGRDFRVSYVPADRNNENFIGRASGGLAIHYRQIIGKNCKPLMFSIRFQ